MQFATVIAGLSWDPAIRGILSVAVGVVVLLGSVYLLLATNTGARLGFQLAAAGLFGWLTILTLMWWVQPPGIGPRGGNEPHWKPVEIIIAKPGETVTPKTAAVESLMRVRDLPTPSQILADQAGTDLAAQLPKNPTLGDILNVSFTATVNGTPQTMTGKKLLQDQYGVAADQKLNGWKLVSTADAGEAQTAADAALVAQNVFKDATAYKKLDVFEYGGNPTLEDDCPNAVGEGEKNLVPKDALCRFWARIKKTFRLWHPPHYEVVQVQQVIPQEARPGEPPPTPKVDPDAPVISVVLIRDQGNVRLKPAMFFLISASLFAFFCLLLHFRDKIAWSNRNQKPVKAGA
ncbi:MAG: hypothetical protein N2037_09980 [Acidimicrobiales bacterium]|nr:hypothetical protein [Acidimicrobiales bacterium]